jgi:hypothetical protein
MTPCADAADAGAPSHEEGSSKGKTRRCWTCTVGAAGHALVGAAGHALSALLDRRSGTGSQNTNTM